MLTKGSKYIWDFKIFSLLSYLPINKGKQHLTTREWQIGTKCLSVHNLRCRNTCRSQWLHALQLLHGGDLQGLIFQSALCLNGFGRDEWREGKGKERVEQWDKHCWKDSEGRELLGSKNVNTCLHFHVHATSPHPKYITMDATTTRFIMFFAVFNQSLFPPGLAIPQQPLAHFLWLCTFNQVLPELLPYKQWFYSPPETCDKLILHESDTNAIMRSKPAGRGELY